MKTTFEPLGDRVVIRPIEGPTMKGRIYLPQAHVEKPTRGTVIAVGPGRFEDDRCIYAMQLKVGDVVIYGKYTGTSIDDDDDKEIIIVREVDIIAKINTEE